MVRPRRQQEASDYILGVRFTPDEKVLLYKLVEHQNQELQAQGVAATVTASSLLRTLVRQRAMQLGLEGNDNAAKVTAPTKNTAKSRFSRVIDDDHMAQFDDAKAVGKPTGRKK
jgi:hypothetical protein